MSIADILDKYFPDLTLYFNSSDALQNIEGDTYLTYKKRKDAFADKVELYFGGDNGEVCICVTSNAETLDTLIKTIIHG